MDLISFALGFHLVAAIWCGCERTDAWGRQRGALAFGFWWNVAFALFAIFNLATGS